MRAFFFRLSHGPVDSDSLHNIASGNKWIVQFQIAETDTFLADLVNVGFLTRTRGDRGSLNIGYPFPHIKMNFQTEEVFILNLS